MKEIARSDEEIDREIKEINNQDKKSRQSKVLDFTNLERVSIQSNNKILDTHKLDYFA